MTEMPRLRSLLGVCLRHWIALRRTWKVALTWFLIEPAFVLMAMGGGVGRLVPDIPGHGSYAHFVTPGLIVGMAMFHALFDCAWGVFNRIQQGAYDTLLTSPASVAELAAGEALWGGLRASLSTLAIGSFAIALGWMPLPSLPGVLLVCFFVGLLFGTVGLCFASASPTMSTLTLVFTVLATPLFFFSGSFFPIDVLPALVQPMAWIAPLTPGVHLARGVVIGELGGSHLWSGLYMLGLLLLLFPVAVRVMSRRLIK